MSIAFLGGSFDPVHYGHLRLAWALTELLPIRQLKFIPSFASVHKARAVATPQQRVEMLRLAMHKIHQWDIETYELEQQRPVYTIETLQFLRAQHPETPLIWIIGSDQWQQFQKWKDADQLHQWANWVVVTRGRHIENSLDPHTFQLTSVSNPAELTLRLNGGIYFADLPILEISSQSIRHCYAQKRSPKFWLPEAVEQYIVDHHLYIQ